MNPWWVEAFGPVVLLVCFIGMVECTNDQTHKEWAEQAKQRMELREIQQKQELIPVGRLVCPEGVDVVAYIERSMESCLHRENGRERDRACDCYTVF